MGVDKTGLLELLARLDAELAGRHILVAAGGTALTLHDLKTSTEDIDVIVAEGDGDKTRRLASRLSDSHVDVFDPGMVWFSPLPADYVSEAVGYGSFANMDLYALGIPDIVITKAARLSRNDWRDITACRESTTWIELERRLTAYPKNNSVQQNNMRKVRINVFGAPPDELVRML